MKTIEERAEESANNATIHKLSDSWYIHRNGYIKGAIEQTNFIRMRITSGGEGAYKPYNGSTYYIDIL